jgi:membrane-bound lytic murein transglycosylase F
MFYQRRTLKTRIPCSARWRMASWLPLVGLLASCSLFDDNTLAQVKSSGELAVLTYKSPTTFFDSPEGPAGFEYDLAKAFADYLGVKLKLVVAESFGDILPRLQHTEADLAAAGLTPTESRRAQFRFTPPYMEIRQQVVYRLGTSPPARIPALAGRQIEVHAGTSYAERLHELRQQYPELTWTEVEDKETDELLQSVWEGLLELTIAYSHIVALNRQFFPELQVAFDIHTPVALSWAFPPGEDDSLYNAAVQFLEESRTSGELASLVDRYYGPASRSSYVNLTVYRLRIQNRLPEYQTLFERAAKHHNLDWRLLAAIGYQESYWDPRAVSSTGVRGLMMLTEETAQQLDVADRLDPESSISGGARYIRQMIDRIPPGVTGPDRVWMALAAYNIGIHHLEDARIITQSQGGDPDKWNDVKERLPLLAQRAWYSTARFGYARGQEPVRFVNRVRTYYDVLVRTDEEERSKKRSEALKMRVPAI